MSFWTIIVGLVAALGALIFATRKGQAKETITRVLTRHKVKTKTIEVKEPLKKKEPGEIPSPNDIDELEKRIKELGE